MGKFPHGLGQVAWHGNVGNHHPRPVAARLTPPAFLPVEANVLKKHDAKMQIADHKYFMERSQPAQLVAHLFSNGLMGH